MNTLTTMCRAPITGITGQDGSYLAEHLLSLDYEVHGLVRRVAMEIPEHRFRRLAHVLDRCTATPGISRVIRPLRRHQPPSVRRVLSPGPAELRRGELRRRLLDDGHERERRALRAGRAGAAPAEMPLLLAGSSEMFGRVRESPQNELTPFNPRSPYGISKVAGYYLTLNYRETYGLFTSIGILFNHESPRRGHESVTRQVCTSAAKIKLGLATDVRLGNLDAVRDWGHARDYVQAMHLMLQQDTLDDFVVATGRPHTVRDLCSIAFATVDLDYRDHVLIDERFVRPVEAPPLVGDASKAKRVLGWEPTVGFEEMVKEMVECEVEGLGGGGAVRARSIRTSA